MDFLFALLVIVIGWIIISARLRRMSDRLEATEAQRAELTRRIWELEQTVARRTLASAEPRVAPTPPPMTVAAAVSAPPPPAVEHGIAAPLPRYEPQPDAISVPAPAPKPAPLPAPAAIFGEPAPALESEPASLPEPAPIFREPEPARPSLSERLAASMAGAEWEALLGGNLLNKLGVLILIIGIGLFLGYSFTQMGPAGRVATAIAVSAGMLLGGIAVERRSQYRVFSAGLIGGGWAGIYFTAYAAHAIPAARIIENPWLASIVLSAVAAGILTHSLKYRSQAITGLAYFVAFATFALTPVTSFAVLALFPLAASLLYLAHRFDWYRMALFGVLATYATCASRGDSGASVLAASSVVGGYWLLFELFVILRASKPGRFALEEQLIFPLNTLGLLALSLPKWNSVAHGRLWAFAAGVAVLHLAGALIRGRVRPTSTDPETNVFRRMASGGYEAPITLAAVFAAFAIFWRLTTVWINFGLIVEAQLLVLAGVRLGHVYLQRLGAAVFGVATLKLLLNDADLGPPRHWSPVALLSAALMYLNRKLCGAGASYFTYGAAVVISLVIGYLAPAIWVIAAWFAFAALLFEFGVRRGLIEFRFQAYGVTVAAMIAWFVNNLGAADPLRWLPVGVATALAYWLCIRVQRTAASLDELEQRFAPLGFSIAATLCAVLFAAFAAPAKFIGAAWVMLAALMLELGLRGLPSHFQRLAYLPLALGWLHVTVTGVAGAQKTFTLVSRMNVGMAALFSYAISARVFAFADRERRNLHALAAGAGTVFGATLLWIVLPHPAVAVGWAALSLALVELGIQFDGSALRRLGDLLAAATFGRLFLANFVNFGATAGISHRLLSTVPVIAAWYYSWFRRQNIARARLYLYGAATAAVILMRFELGRAIAIVGWAVFGTLLFWLGARLRQFDFRAQAYFIAILCFWRGWATSFYAPESLAGSAGRIAAAAIVVLALHAAEFLAPRDGFPAEGRPRPWRSLEQYPRVLFAILAAALVTILLRNEVSGGMLTVAWGIQAVTLLAAGFMARERVLRLAGLTLFLVCILKLFLYDLRHLETMNRILSFIVLGGVMVGVSWIYTRFRGQIQKYL